ncbi:MAG: hypothetical protein ABSD31_17250 [Candidatus Binataceae bacterium]|jgi:hypothetical protein
MNFGRGWLFLVPLLAFIATGMLLSCGGNSGCGGTYDELGQYEPNTGQCVNGPGITPAPPNGNIVSISICQGAPPPPTALPTVTAGMTATPTVAPTPCGNFFTATAVPQGCFAQFHAVATLNNNDTVDITQAGSSNWTSSEPSELSPTTLQGTQGIYAAVGAPGGPYDVVVSAPGVASSPVPVMIDTASTPCPTVILLPSTPAPTPTT